MPWVLSSSLEAATIAPRLPRSTFDFPYGAPRNKRDLSRRAPALRRQCPHATARSPVDVATLLERIARPGDGVLGFGFARADQLLVGSADVAVLHHALDDGMGHVALV